MPLSTYPRTAYSRPTSTACHCVGCNETFTGLSAFDAHRVDRTHGDAKCAAPADVGLILRERPAGTLWGYPGDDTRFDA